MKILFKYFRQYRITCIVSLILIIISSLTSIIIPRLIGDFTSEAANVNGTMNIDGMKSLAITMLIIAVVGLVAGVINTFFSARLSQDIGADMRNEGFRKVQSFSYQDIEKFKTANIVVRLTNDINQIQSAIGLIFGVLMRMPVLLIGSFIMAMLTLPQLWYVIVIMFVLVAITMAIVFRKMFPIFGRFQFQIDKINSIVKENFEGARVVKSFATESKEEKKFNVQNDTLAKFNLRIGRIMAVVFPMIMLIANMLTVFVIFISIDMAKTDMSVIGSMVSYINYLMQLMMSLLIGGMVLMQFSRAFVSIRRYEEIINTNTSINYVEKGPDHIIGDIEFRDVTFTYPDSVYPSLKDINLKISHGQTIGVIGATGSGKTTLVHLLLRLFDINNGELLIDGINIKQIPQKTLRDDISIVLQKPILFSGTIEENIINGNDVNEKEMRQAARDAQASEFIEKLASSYNSNVQQRGSNFSGGQKQRLSIARGLLKKPPILILDDATSALDARSERLVKEALYENYDDQTVIIIAQKIASIIEADKIIVMNNGHLVGFDTHQNLLKDNATYQEIFASQKGRDQYGK